MQLVQSPQISPHFIGAPIESSRIRRIIWSNIQSESPQTATTTTKSTKMEVPAFVFPDYYQSINPNGVNTPQNNVAPDNKLENTWVYPMLCYNCGTYASALWTTDSNGFSLCNNCCYHRKHVSIDRPYTKTRRLGNRNDFNKCFNCQTDKTTLWRRNNEGERVCNSCGLYFKMHGFNRPPSMRKETIQTRKRKPKNVRANNYQPTPLANFNGFDHTNGFYYLNAPTEARTDPISVSNDALANPPPPYFSSHALITTPETPVNLKDIQYAINNL